jgi:hypothetical protein
MTKGNERLDQEFVSLALAVNEHLPGYIDSYFGPEERINEAKQAGKLPLRELTARVARLAMNISQTEEWDSQRKDFLAHPVSAMQMNLRLLTGANVSLAEEAQALYDIQPTWKDEAYFREYQKWLAENLPKGGQFIGDHDSS